VGRLSGALEPFFCFLRREKNADQGGYMRFIGRITGFIILLMIMAYAGVWMTVTVKGDDLFVEQAERLYNRDVSVDKVSFSPLLGATVSGLSIEGVLSADSVSISLNPFYLLKRTIGINSVEVRGLETTLTRSPQGAFATPLIPDAVGRSPATGQNQRLPIAGIPLHIGRVSVFDSEITFDDGTDFTGRPVVFDVAKAVAYDISWPLTSLIQFRANSGIRNGNAPDGNAVDDLQVKGWIDWPERDMDVTMDVRRLTLDNARCLVAALPTADFLGLKQAMFDLSARFIAEDDLLTVKSNVSVPSYECVASNLRRHKIVRTVLYELSRGQQYPSKSFIYRTSMSAPSFDVRQLLDQMDDVKDQVTLALVMSVAGDTAQVPVDVLRNAAKGALGTTRAIGELADSLLGSLLGKK
jgi:hypothetical protein